MSRIKFDVRYKGLLSAGYEARDISNQDLNDMMYSGVFHGFRIDNAPDDNYIETIVTRHNENWVVQESKDYVDRIYLRSYKDDEWSEWTELVVSHSCDEPDKEFIVVERPHSHGVATPHNHGFMSAEDKAKLDLIDIDGAIRPGSHNHIEYEEGIANLNSVVTDLNENKSDKDHEHDERYIPVFSSRQPTNHTIAGQVWIETN